MPGRASVKSRVRTYPLALRRHGKRPGGRPWRAIPTKAFSSEAATGSRQENAPKHKSRARSDSIGTEKALGWCTVHRAGQNVRHFIQSLRITSWALLAAIACLPATPAIAEKRIALAIGNDLYANLPADRQLRKAANDATTV